MKVNKKLFLIDMLTFCGTLVLYTITFISNNIFGLYNIIANIILCFLAVAVSVCSMFFSYNKMAYEYGTSFVNLLISVFFSVIVYLIYILPFFKFVGNKGINNSICFLMIFTFGVRNFLEISEILKSKNTDTGIKTLNNSLNYSKNIFKYGYKLFKYFGLVIFVIAILVSVINSFLLFIDMSEIFDDFSELDLQITIFGQKVK